MSKCFLRTKKYLLIVAICLSCFAISGCVESINYLASDSRLPKWLTLPPGLTRADVKVGLEFMEPTRRGVDIKVVLTDRKYKKLEEVRQEEKFPVSALDSVESIYRERALLLHDDLADQLAVAADRPVLDHVDGQIDDDGQHGKRQMEVGRR